MFGGMEVDTHEAVRQGGARGEGKNRVTWECPHHLPGREPFPQRTEACHISPS